ncbi:MAG: SdiA-regulated domain-containing protein [Ginsengibacter sp.]
MRLQYLLVCLVVILESPYCTGCHSANKKEEIKKENKNEENAAEVKMNYASIASSKEYDLNNPTIIKLPQQLNEISGISFYPKDTSLFAIVDEAGILYKIYLHRNNQVQSWTFDKRHDFEDVVLQDSTFYVLISNGDIEQLKFNGNAITASKSVFPGSDKKVNEFETLYYDDKKGLVLICKQCEDDKKKAVSAYGYDPSAKTFNPSLFYINVLPIDEKLGEQKIHLKPSAAAINPVTNELYILCSVNKLLVVADRDGNFKDVFTLDDKIYKQPEGITFTPAGDMIISNEWHEEGSPTLLVLKRNK